MTWSWLGPDLLDPVWQLLTTCIQCPALPNMCIISNVEFCSKCLFHSLPVIPRKKGGSVILACRRSIIFLDLEVGTLKTTCRSIFTIIMVLRAVLMLSVFVCYYI